MSSRVCEPAAASRAAMSAMSSTSKPRWWMPCQPRPRSTVPSTSGVMTVGCQRIVGAALSLTGVALTRRLFQGAPPA
jgi:hypothetical protein